eukprot:jgi/Astpho2/9379/e_gw1.00145.49.1_t
MCLQAYAGAYRGHAKLDRLLFIADKTKNPQLALEAYKLAHDEAKQGQDMSKYRLICDKINGRLGPQYQYKMEHAEQVERRGEARLAKLDSELNGYKTNLVQESIRMGHNAIGEHCYERGDLQGAFKSYVRARDYCTTGKHLIQMCLNVIRASVEMNNYVHVNNYVQKAESTPDVQSDVVVTSKLKAALGLAQLHNKKYKMAAKRFTEVHNELGNSYNDVLSAQDLALFGGLTALATLERSELRSCVIDRISFREFLESHPQMRQAVYAFHDNKYATCLEMLQRMLPAMRLDIHLAPHVDTLYKEIRNRALIQYTMPFTSVRLTSMAEAFNTNESALEKELAVLIQDGPIQARIDSHNKVLYARHADRRTATFQEALQIGEDFIRETNALLLRANVMRHDLVQRAPNSAAAPSMGSMGMGGRRGGALGALGSQLAFGV